MKLMKDCVFCRIVAKEIPCYKVYEDEDFLAFLDINPRVLGHTLVIPKKHYRWVYDVPNFDAYWRVVKKITMAMKKALKPKFITYVTYGLDIPHAHIHIIPRQANETAAILPEKHFSSEEMKDIATKISSTLKES